ncbi:MAG: M48 family metalloprotease, partial [Pseudomonadota bacterium]
RSRVKTHQDPIIVEYLDELIQKLLVNNPHHFKTLSFILVDNPEINAFAVPGGIMGINLGVFLSAQSEGQLASIIAHELAHLSERHHARMLSQSKQQKLPVYTGLLLGMALAAAGSAEGAQAVIASTQAAAIHSKLRFSRTFEQEADSAGLRNLIASGYQKSDMVAMFDVLNTQAGHHSINNKPLEYLLTHPLPDSRINRLKQLNLGAQENSKARPSNRSFQLLKTLTELHYQRQTRVNSLSYRNRLRALNPRTSPLKHQAAQFGLAAALVEEGNTTQALSTLRTLIAQQPGESIYQAYYIRTLIKARQYTTALAYIARQPQHSSRYAMSLLTVQALNGDQQHAAAQQRLFSLLKHHSDQPLVWHMLAETSGKMNDRVQLHESRAEYYVLMGRLKAAQQQLDYALKLNTLVPGRKSALLNRLSTIKALIKERQKLGFN